MLGCDLAFGPSSPGPLPLARLNVSSNYWSEMAFASRPRGPWDWNQPWLYGILATVLILTIVGVGIATGAIHRHTPNGPVVITSPSPGHSPSPTPRTTPSPTPSPSVVAQLKGKIAVSNGQPGSGGWITFPGGTFTPDPASNVALPTGWAPGLAHDLALNKWVPVPRDWVSPDGKKYVYFDSTTFHVVGYQSSDWLFSPPVTGINSYWTVLWAENDGVYVTSPGLGVWRVGYGGGMRQVTNNGYWSVANGKYAYGTLTSSVPQGAATTVVRVDLASGTVVDVFTRPGMRSTAVGVASDGGAVVLSTDSAPVPTMAQLWLAQPGTAVQIVQTISNSSMPGPGFTVYSVVADSMGSWIATTSGLYLFSKQSGLELASTVTGPLASTLRP